MSTSRNDEIKQFKFAIDDYLENIIEIDQNKEIFARQDLIDQLTSDENDQQITNETTTSTQILCNSFDQQETTNPSNRISFAQHVDQELVSTVNSPSTMFTEINKYENNKQKLLEYIDSNIIGRNVIIQTPWKPRKETGVELIRIPNTKQGLIDRDYLQKQLEYYHNVVKKRIICSFNAASNITGILTDVNDISKLVHQYDGLIFWDYAAGAPYLKIDMNPSEVSSKDAVFISTHKFVGGPSTQDILIAKKHLFNNRVPHFRKYLHHHFICVLLNDLFGIQVRSGCSCADPYVIDLLGINDEKAKIFTKFITEDEANMVDSITKNALMKPGFTRFNLSYFLSDEEVEYILDAIEFVANEGWKFLSLYTFDPLKATWRPRHMRKENNLTHLHSLQMTRFRNRIMQEDNTNDESSESLKLIFN